MKLAPACTCEHRYYCAEGPDILRHCWVFWLPDLGFKGERERFRSSFTSRYETELLFLL